MKLFGQLFRVSYNTQASRLVAQIDGCRKNLKDIRDVLSTIRSKKTFKANYPKLRSKYDSLYAKIKSILSTIKSVKQKFASNVNRMNKPVNGNNNASVYVSLSSNGKKYVITKSPPIVKMEAVIQALKKRVAAEVQNVQNIQPAPVHAPEEDEPLNSTNTNALNRLKVNANKLQGALNQAQKNVNVGNNNVNRQ
jgi:hypothetical protein